MTAPKVLGVEMSGYKDYGYLAAVEPQYAIGMSCEACKTRWTGCWDAFECPECGEGELPSSAIPDGPTARGGEDGQG